MLKIEDHIKSPIPIKKELQLLLTRKDLVILDIGACTGEDSIRYSMLFPFAKIFAVEPLPTNIEVMRKHFLQFEKPSIEVREMAFSDRDGTAEFYVSSGNPSNNIPENANTFYTTLWPESWNKSSSLLPPADNLQRVTPWLEFKSSIQVKTQTLNSFLKDEGLHRIDFIHLDVQGAELAVLKGANDRIKNIGMIWLEVENEELYLDQPLKTDINKYLKLKSFSLIKDSSKHKVSGDCLYVNPSYFSVTKQIIITLIRLRFWAKNIVFQRLKK